MMARAEKRAAPPRPWFLAELDRRRVEKGWTLEQLAERIVMERTTAHHSTPRPLSVSTLIRILQGTRTFLDFRLVEAIGEALDLELDFYSVKTGKKRRRRR
jgi:transcriptional regulator with XRE-family HTH domain